MSRFTVLLLLACLACIDKKSAQKAIEAVQSDGPRPDVMPVMLNEELPFRYPPALYAGKVQGNVTLRIHIDSTGAVWPESTSVVQSSGYAALDSAAVKGSQELRFRPATLKGKPLGVSILLPVFFRHPKGRPLPGDTVLRGSGKREAGAVRSARDSTR
jgi:TonB family protein